MISRELWCDLPLRVRIAVGATLGDKILQMYSTAFRETFLQDSTMELVWRFVDGKPTPQASLDRAFDECQRVFENAESYGYDFYEVCIPESLIEEMLRDDGRGIACATSGIEIAYLSQVCYCHHIAPTDRRLNKIAEDVDTIQKMVWPVIQGAYDSAKGLAENAVTGQSFSGIDFPDPNDLSLFALSFRKIAKKPSDSELIPEFEREK